MTKDEALDLALEFVSDIQRGKYKGDAEEVITAIKQARALDKKAENARELGLDYEPVGLIDRLKNPEQHYEFTDPKKANAVLMSLCQEAADALAVPVQEMHRYSPDGEGGMEVDSLGAYVKLQDVTTPPAQPAPVQEPEHTVRSNGRYSPLLTSMMNKRVESNVKQVIHLYDKPPAAQRQWVGLTPTERKQIEKRYVFVEDAIRLTEAKLKEKNT
jgi:hypothetical protein